MTFNESVTTLAHQVSHIRWLQMGIHYMLLLFCKYKEFPLIVIL